jgi:Arc/MetJ-type ribon-helix-helix transcriptional regulator
MADTIAPEPKAPERRADASVDDVVRYALTEDEQDLLGIKPGEKADKAPEDKAAKEKADKDAADAKAKEEADAKVKAEKEAADKKAAEDAAKVKPADVKPVNDIIGQVFKLGVEPEKPKATPGTPEFTEQQVKEYHELKIEKEIAKEKEILGRLFAKYAEDELAILQPTVTELVNKGEYDKLRYTKNDKGEITNEIRTAEETYIYLLALANERHREALNELKETKKQAEIKAKEAELKAKETIKEISNASTVTTDTTPKGKDINELLKRADEGDEDALRELALMGDSEEAYLKDKKR